MTPIATGRFAAEIMGKLHEMQDEAKSIAQGIGGAGGLGTKGGQAGVKDNAGMSFADHMKQSINEVNAIGKTSDKMNVELASGKSGNIHDTMLAATQAELSFNLMVQLRNKGLEAYSEIMKMPV